MDERGEVIFVGGAAFSGTELVGQFLGAHPRLAALPIAARFHSDDHGMPALLGGRVGLDDFLRRLRGPWWTGSREGDPGLGEVVDRARFEAEVERFRGSYYDDPLAACRELFLSLLAPAGGDERRLVEASAANMTGAQTLVKVFPAARFVHVVRDGRDSAAGMGRWAHELREIESAIRGEEDGAPYAMPAGSFGVVVLDQLAAGDREASYRALLALLALDDDPQMRSFFEERVGAEQIGRGRWRADTGGLGAWVLSRRYRRALANLERERNHAARPLMEAYERLG